MFEAVCYNVFGDYMNQNINQIAHHFILVASKEKKLALDATCGNGNDTLFLAQNFQNVHAIDIQKQAIVNTRTLLKEHNVQNVTIHQISHDRLNELFSKDTRFNCIVYNLGYLPRGNHALKTKAKSTVLSLKQALTLLAPDGYISITLYVGHEGGNEEAKAVEKFVSQLEKRQYSVFRFSYLNRHQSPYVIGIVKTN
jgi:methylase of polypeptide subunit release factors